MSASLPSDEVADDYRNSLEDLVSNDRYQISTLTLIAKENIEHAEAISRVLQNHIYRTPPPRKLPALYVLDSIVKNVGTPYTVYFGRNLHTTFIHAYSQVDAPIRRKLEEMLKTWREPVPGSLSVNPVFPISTTQPLVDSLNRYRAATPQARVHQPSPAPRVVQPMQQHIPTPPPPNHVAYPAQGYQAHPQPLPQNGATYQTPSQAFQFPQVNQPNYPQAFPYPSAQAQVPPAGYQSLQMPASNPGPSYHPSPATTQRPSSSGAVDMAKLHADIDDLTTDAKIECATHPMDQGAKTKLASLQSLKEILDGGNMSEKDLLDIRDSILQQKAEKLRLQARAPSVQPQPPPMSNPVVYPLSQGGYNPPPSAPPPFVNQANLAQLLQAASSRNQPQPAYGSQFLSQPPTIPTPPTHHAEPAPLVAELPLLAQLRASGLLSTTPTPPQSLTPVIPPPSMIQLPGSIEIQVALTSASVKIPRPQLITSFLNTRPNQCTTCGRRFSSDETGKEKKSRHLDWHFKTKARMSEAEHRSQTRSWYVDEREWISSKEYEDDAAPGEVGGEAVTNGPSLLGAKKAMQDYVRAPSDPVLRHAPCPIDQETFKSEWSEELQDFIWKDAVLVGGRYYHASCYKEATRDRDKDAGGLTPLGAGTARTSTPDSVLGKRKAEDSSEGVKSKFKLEVPS